MSKQQTNHNCAHRDKTIMLYIIPLKLCICLFEENGSHSTSAFHQKTSDNDMMLHSIELQ